MAEREPRLSALRTLLELFPWLPSRSTLWVVALLGLLGGLFEATVVALLSGVAAAVAQGRELFEVSLGPVDVSFTTGQALAAGFGITVMMVAAKLAASWLGSRLTARTLLRTRTQLLDEYLSSSFEVQRSLLQAELHELVAVQAMRLSQATLMVTGAVANALAFLALVGVAVLIDPVTAGLMLGLSVVLVVVFYPLVRRSHRAGATHVNSQVAVGVDLGDVTGLLAETMVYDARDGMLGRAAASITASGRAMQTAALVSQATPALFLGAVFVLLFGGLLVVDAMGPTDLQTVGAIVLLTLRGLRYSQQVLSGFQVAAEQGENITSVAEASRRFQRVALSTAGHELDRLETLEFREVSYHHPGTTEGIHDVSLHLRRGEIVGVVGHSGSGKSTFAEVALGLREPTGGQVVVNGRPRGEYRSRTWFDRVAYVGQESRLLAGSVESNVAFFRDVAPDAVQEAYRSASLSEDLARWEAGAQRDVGSGGRDVSGGQRQRVAIARALAGNPDMIVMDEPTSALDPESEQRIRESIAALAGKVLVVVVAHRHSTLVVCDRILRFDQGRCAEVSVDALDTVPIPDA